MLGESCYCEGPGFASIVGIVGTTTITSIISASSVISVYSIVSMFASITERDLTHNNLSYMVKIFPWEV